MRKIFIYLFLALSTCAVYWPVRHFAFVNYDDETYIYENKHVAQGLTPANARWAFQSFEVANYHPFTWLSFLLDSSLFGVRPAAFHIENVLLHILNALLLFGLLKSATKQIGPSAFVAAIFALHPVHVESVAWVSERKDVLSTVFLLLAAWAYLGYARAHVSGKCWLYYLTMILCFICGLLAKPMIVTFPFLLMLLDYWPLRRLRWKNELIEKSPLLLLSLISSIVTYKAQKEGGAVLGLQNVPLILRIENVFVSYVRYLGKSIWPIDLSPYYPFRSDWSGAVIAGSCALIVLLTILFIRQRRNRPYLIMGWLWFLGALVPVIGIVQAGGQSIADRYLYIPLIGLSIMVAWMGVEVARYSRAGIICLAAIAVIGAGITARHQLNYWRDTRTLFEHALTVINGNAVAHVQLGYLDAREGNTIGAIDHYDQAIRLDPNDYVSEFNYANLLLKDHPDQAVEHYRNAAMKNPRAAKVQNNWGRALIDLNQPGEAYQHFVTAVRLDPNFPDPHANMGWLLLGSGLTDLAEKEFREALRIDPDFPSAQHGLAAWSAAKSAKPK
jgi:Flp pilus assembly protein TadD